VIASGVLSHQEDDRQALTEITRLLKRGGLVIVTLPNAIKLRNLFDPYYYLLVVRRLLAKWLPRGRGRGAGATEFVRGGTFTVRKYVYGRVRRLFERYSLRVTGFAGCGFGPFTVFRRRILPASQTARISDCIEGLSARRSLSFLKRCANTLVLQMVRDA
jgi:ubiquinone/menaquinone biosynthesis C-methylase UbiE